MTATLTTALEPSKTTRAGAGGAGPARKRMRSFYPAWFFIPAIALYVVFFAVPTFAGFYFSLTRWTLFDQTFIGFDNFVRFFQDPQLVSGFVHTFEYGFVTSAAKVVLGLALALLLTSPVLGRGYLRAVVFFPVLVSTIGIGITFKALMDPFHGIINSVLGGLGLPLRAG
ncbi:ABC-type sugar transport system permease subunit [Curtobacterium pusillum]|uniref:ABC-type sugar transport system permease subunit n=1 Tax=Curtobacterium pusillum TaxID=69373 RepID=A0AAW3T7S9_9MICO|nr:ABC-type sugar transport system permease subunit [Curtobacterium pusillum]